eukprot:m.387659 g.387659  ORF g.387659 m.387659 type:complete len:321 (+) comp21034_c1_seq3:413-1375(+)
MSSSNEVNNAIGKASTPIGTSTYGMADMQMLWAAMKSNNVEEIKRITTQYPEIVRCNFGHNNTPIKAATYICMKGNVTVIPTVRTLLDANCHPDDRVSAVDDTHWTALHKAVVDENEPLIKLLLEYGADVHLTWQGKKMEDLTDKNNIKELVSKPHHSEKPPVIMSTTTTPSKSVPETSNADPTNPSKTATEPASDKSLSNLSTNSDPDAQVGNAAAMDVDNDTGGGGTHAEGATSGDVTSATTVAEAKLADIQLSTAATSAGSPAAQSATNGSASPGSRYAGCTNTWWHNGEKKTKVAGGASLARQRLNVCVSVRVCIA